MQEKTKGVSSLTAKEKHTTRTHLHNEMEGEWQSPRNIYSRKKKWKQINFLICFTL